MAVDWQGWIEPLQWAWNNRSAIKKRLTAIQSWLKGRSDVIVLGPAGTGKSTLAKFLAGKHDPLLDSFVYEESIGVEHHCFADKPDIGLVVLPGQEDRREATWSQFLTAVSTGKYRGLIFLTAYGYHNFPVLGFKQHRLFRGNKAKFLASYLADRRKEELAVLKELVSHLVGTSKRTWLLTVIAKQDLWWRQRDVVRDHYEDGAFAESIKQIAETIGRNRFRNEFVYLSLVIRNFVDGTESSLQSNTASYDYPLQVQSRRRLVETVGTLRDWETGP